MLFRTLQSFANEALDAIPSETGHAAIHRRFLPFGLQPDLPWLHETPVLLGGASSHGRAVSRNEKPVPSGRRNVGLHSRAPSICISVSPVFPMSTRFPKALKILIHPTLT